MLCLQRRIHACCALRGGYRHDEEDTCMLCLKRRIHACCALRGGYMHVVPYSASLRLKI
jgi:hypothetical protein